jgi:hypothetical protein
MVPEYPAMLKLVWEGMGVGRLPPVVGVKGSTICCAFTGKLANKPATTARVYTCDFRRDLILKIIGSPLIFYEFISLAECRRAI